MIDFEDNEAPSYSFAMRVVDVVFNFLTAVGVIAAAGVAGYFYARWF